MKGPLKIGLKPVVRNEMEDGCTETSVKAPTHLTEPQGKLKK